MKEVNKWNITITTYANVGSLTDELIAKIFSCYDSKYYQQWLIEFAKNDDKFSTYPVAVWQLEKSREIEKLFHKSMVYERSDGIINCYVNLEIMFPESFERGDVIEWVEGFHRYSKVHVLNESDEYVETQVSNVNREVEREFLKELNSNQKWIVNNSTL